MILFSELFGRKNQDDGRTTATTTNSVRVLQQNSYRPMPPYHTTHDTTPKPASYNAPPPPPPTPKHIINNKLVPCRQAGVGDLASQLLLCSLHTSVPLLSAVKALLLIYTPKLRRLIIEYFVHTPHVCNICHVNLLCACRSDRRRELGG